MLALPYPHTLAIERMMAMVDQKAYGRLRASKKKLSRQQYKTIKGQIRSGYAEGAMRGLGRILSEVKSK